VAHLDVGQHGPNQASDSTPLVYKTDKSNRKAPAGVCLRAFWRGGMLIPCQRRTCPACGPRRARETGRMLVIDAKAGEAPRYSITLTTRDPATHAEQVRRGMQNVVLGLRRRFGRAEYFARIEFTTGTAPTSGGHRRIHVHMVVKGEPGWGLAEAHGVIRSAWMARNPGAWRIQLAVLRTVAGALHYLSLHHAKAEQTPPPWWTGRTERVSRGYFSRPQRALREEARARLWAERLAYSTGLSVGDARFVVDQELAARARIRALAATAADERRWVPVSEAIEAGEVEAKPAQLRFDDGDIPF
jgi:LysM repeat protein